MVSDKREHSSIVRVFRSAKSPSLFKKTHSPATSKPKTTTQDGFSTTDSPARASEPQDSRGATAEETAAPQAGPSERKPSGATFCGDSQHDRRPRTDHIAEDRASTCPLQFRWFLHTAGLFIWKFNTARIATVRQVIVDR